MPSKKLRIPQFHYKFNYYIANMKFLAKKFAIIIYLRKYNAFRQKQKNESPCEFPSVKQCVNLLSSAIDRRDALGIGSP